MPITSEQCELAILRTLRAMSFPGINSAEIMARDRPLDWVSLPRGMWLIQDAELTGTGAANKHDIGYSFGLYRVSGTSGGSGDAVRPIQDWRDKVRKTFASERLEDVPENFICAVRRGLFLRDREWQHNKAISAVNIVCWCREA